MRCLVRSLIALASLAAPTLHSSAHAAVSGRWLQLAPQTHPSARAGHAAAYDPVNKKLVIFGGVTATRYLADTWTYDGSNWTRLSTPVAPPARTAADMAYDEVTKQLVLFGGYDGNNFLGDTWLFDVATRIWTAAQPSVSPPSGTGPAMFTDPSNGHATVFGGFNGYDTPGTRYKSQTWQWSGSDWVQRETSNAPLARSATTVALDLAHHNVVMFGGLADLFVYDTSTWDGVDWRLENPSEQPSLRFDSAAAYSPNIGAVILFGGFSGIEVRDTWAWDGANWSMIIPILPGAGPKPIKIPSARELHSLVYFPPTGQLILFGGENAQGPFSDTWAFVP